MEQFHRLYNKLQLLNEGFNRTFGGSLLPCLKVVFGGYTVVSIYGCIKIIQTGGNLAMAFILFTNIIFSVSTQSLIYPTAGALFAITQDFKSTLYSQPKGEFAETALVPTPAFLPRVYRKMVLSTFAPVKVSIGRKYHVQPGTYLSFLSIAVDYTITLLLG
jgi:hypothetical protein